MGTLISTLEKTRQQVKNLLFWHLRLCIWLLAGSLGFLMPGTYITKILNEPESYLRLNSQFLNHQELQTHMTSVNPGFYMTTIEHKEALLNAFILSSCTRAKFIPIDPDWDGALAGLSIGVTLATPFATPSAIFTLPLIGAIVGYKVDQKVH